MTQIIGLITHDYVMLASDRRLTFISGNNTGQIKDDDTCKMVLFNGICGIAYTGISEISNLKTNQWIAIRLAEAKPRSPIAAAAFLAQRAEAELANSWYSGEQSFLFAGWWPSDSHLRPYFGLVTNTRDQNGDRLASPTRKFVAIHKTVHNGEDPLLISIGHPFITGRYNRLLRALKQLHSRGISAVASLRLLISEVRHTSSKSNTVGSKILCFSMSRRAAIKSFSRDMITTIASKPTDDHGNFSYFDPDYNELRQLGPTSVSGGYAIDDVEGGTDVSNNTQFASVRILRTPSTPPHA